MHLIILTIHMVWIIAHWWWWRPLLWWWARLGLPRRQLELFTGDGYLRCVRPRDGFVTAASF